ncbi:FG-GAP repeat domain-containing protein [Arthrobacter sp. SAFR-014]|uniref:FG-GAP repeat domain-containing protein n=1 Tax=unclassified Arthrobacter TaxID=235627 RepID=UPI003F7B7693
MTAVVGPGDLTGDRKADILARDASGILWVYRGDGRGGFASRSSTGAGWNAMGTIAGRGDFNGDGRTDALAIDASGVLWLYKGNGAGNWLGRSSMGAGWN